jgi:hypothetical protein
VTLLCVHVVIEHFLSRTYWMASTPESILNDMRLSKISLLSLMVFALSNICDYMDLMNLNDIMPMFELISNIFAAAADS